MSSPSRPAQVRRVARPEVDGGRAPVASDLERSLDAVRDAEGAHEVAAGAAVDDRKLDALEGRDAVDDLVHGAVAADGDEQARASRRSLTGEVDEVARAARR